MEKNNYVTRRRSNSTLFVASIWVKDVLIHICHKNSKNSHINPLFKFPRSFKEFTINSLCINNFSSWKNSDGS